MYIIPYFKGVGLWLKHLWRLLPSAPLTPPERGTEVWKAWSRVHRYSGWRGQAERQRERARFFPGIAAAMADQWGGFAMREAA